MKLFSEDKLFSKSLTLHSSFLHLSSESGTGRFGVAAWSLTRAGCIWRRILVLVPVRHCVQKALSTSCFRSISTAAPRKSSHATACLGRGFWWSVGDLFSWAGLSGGLCFDLGCGNTGVYLPSDALVCSPFLCSSKLSGDYQGVLKGMCILPVLLIYFFLARSCL